MKKIYLVIKTSVYRHDIFGAYQDLDDAKELADELARTDLDNHHGYDVVPVPLNDHYNISKNSTSGNETNEDIAVYSATKKT
jgi:hypothetical protein